jgi:hypothetical protein
MPRTGVHHYGPYERAHRHDTALRMAARRLMLKKLGHIPVGMDVDHIKSIKGGGSNKLSNLRLRDASENRGDKTY